MGFIKMRLLINFAKRLGRLADLLTNLWELTHEQPIVVINGTALVFTPEGSLLVDIPHNLVINTGGVILQNCDDQFVVEVMAAQSAGCLTEYLNDIQAAEEASDPATLDSLEELYES